MASSDLIWHLVKNNNAFLVRRDRCSFSSEPGNLRNLHAARFSGLAQKRVVDIQPTTDGKAVTLSIKATKTSLARKPAQAWRKTTLKKDFRRTAKAIRGSTRNYRSDLTKHALARYTKLYWAAKSKGVAKPVATRKARKAAAVAAARARWAAKTANKQQQQ